MTPSRGKILVIRGGAIGDFILTLPAIAALRTGFPDAHLEILGYPHIVQLALAGGLVDRVQPIEARGLATFFARNGVLDQDWADYFSEFDIILSYLYDPDEIFKTNVGRCSVAQFISGPHRPDEREAVHAARVFLKPLERLAIFDANAVPMLPIRPVAPDPGAEPDQARRGRAAEPAPRNGSAQSQPSLRKCVALHPGSGSEKKNWPEVNWMRLLNSLCENPSLDFLLIGGEAEGERLQRMAAAAPASRVRIAQSLPLPELARRLRGECAAFVGHDSGISHLAAALGLPCLVLWGDSVETIWRPPHAHVTIVKGRQGLRTIPVEQVVNQLAPLCC